MAVDWRVLRLLTPIGHQNNTFDPYPAVPSGDYWRLGLVEVVVVVSMPLLLIVWPL
jgi:hypothetical protein